MQDPKVELVAAIERARAIGLEGHFDSWRAIEASRSEIKKALKALREIIAFEPDVEALHAYQGLLASTKRLHHTLVRARDQAVARTVRDN